MSEIDAYHEAGHAFMAVYLGARVRSVTIEPDRDDGPARFGDTQVEWRPDQFSRRELCERAVLVALAGPVAEMIHRGESCHPSTMPEWISDWTHAWQAAAQIHLDERRRWLYLEGALARLQATLSRDDLWAGLAAIVDHLLTHDRLEAEELEEILEHWLT